MYKVYEFYGDNCVPCKVIAPLVDKIAIQYKEKMELIKVRASDPGNVELVGRFGILSVPTVVVLDEEEEVARYTGMIIPGKLSMLMVNGVS